MKWFVFTLCLFVCTDVVLARGRRSQSSGTGSTSASQNAVIDEAPIYKAEEQLLAAINAERQRFGLIPLLLDRAIHLRARRHCGWMANSHSMVHSNDGAENIAMGYGTVEQAVSGWMGSSGHRANILNSGYRLTGISVYRSPSGTVFWCQQFK